MLTPLERLPKGLPAWFLEKDRNEDGQIAMAEFSNQWDDAKAAEFQGFDLNKDGLITPEECLKTLGVKADPRPRPNSIVAAASDSREAATHGPPPPGPKPKPPGGPKGDKPKKEAVARTTIPSPVQGTITKMAGQAELAKLEKEQKDGEEVYTAKWLVNDREQEVKLRGDGGVLESKEIVDPGSLPAEVREAAAEFAGEGEILECKRKTTYIEGQEAVVYEIKSERRKGPPMRFAADGTMQ